MLYDLAIAIYDILVHLAAPFSRKPRKMMKDELGGRMNFSGSSWRRTCAIYGSMPLLWGSSSRDGR